CADRDVRQARLHGHPGRALERLVVLEQVGGQVVVHRRPRPRIHGTQAMRLRQRALAQLRPVPPVPQTRSPAWSASGWAIWTTASRSAARNRPTSSGPSTAVSPGGATTTTCSSLVNTVSLRLRPARSRQGTTHSLCADTPTAFLRCRSC